MQDIVEVIINEPKEGVLTCTTVNQHPYPSLELFYKSPLLYDQKHKKWHKSESERKTYEIEGVKFMQNGAPYLIQVYAGKDAEYKYLTAGSIHKARIINNKAVIQ